MYLRATIPQASSLVLLLLYALTESAQGLNIPKKAPREARQYELNSKGVRWHESCDDKTGKFSSETKKTAVTRAWAGALQLIDSSWNRFETKTYPILQKGKDGPLDEEAQNDVNKVDPGYVQLFGLDWSPSGVEQVKTILEKLATQANADPGENKRPKNSIININCEETHVLEGIDMCSYSDAVTRPAENNITFCPTFFKLQRFDQFLEKFNDGNQNWVERWYNAPSYTGTDALKTAHELTHLKWLGETNTYKGQSLSEIFWVDDCSAAAWEDGKPKADRKEINLNADTYACYLELGFWTEKGLSDLWPSWAKKPGYIPVSFNDEC